MRTRRKRVTVSLSDELLTEIDRWSRELRETRSGLMEEWLRRGARAAAEEKLNREIERYYRTRTAAQRREDEAIATATSRWAKQIDYDAPSPGPRSRSR